MSYVAAGYWDDGYTAEEDVVSAVTPANCVAGATVQSTTVTRWRTVNPADCVAGAVVTSTSVNLPGTHMVAPSDCVGGATVTSTRVVALSRERAAASAEYPLAGPFREKFDIQPGEMLDYDIKCGRYLDFINDEPVDVNPVDGQAAEGITLVAAYWVPELESIKVWFANGAERSRRYKTTFWLNTKGGRRIEADLQVRVKDY